MQTRREFLVMSACVACAVSVPSLVWAKAGNAALDATAITQVFDDGVQMVAVAVEFADELTAADVQSKDFSVAGKWNADVVAS